MQRLTLLDWRSGKMLQEILGRFHTLVFDIHPSELEWAVVTNDKILRFFELPSGRELRQFEFPYANTALKYHPQGEYLAFAEQGTSTIFQLNPQTGETATLVKRAPSGLMGNLSFNSDGNLIATGSDNWRGYVWETRTGELIATLVGHKAEVAETRFVPQSNLITSWSWDNSIRVWDWTDARLLLRLDGAVKGVSQDGRYLAYVRGRQTGVVRCAPSREFRTLRGHDRKGPLWCRFSPDGRLLVSAGADGMRFWDTSSGGCLAAVPLSKALTAEFLSDGSALLTASSPGLHYWPIRRSKSGCMVGPPVPIVQRVVHERRAAVRPGDREAFVASPDRNQIDIVTLDGAASTILPCDPEPNNCLASPNGKWVVASSWTRKWAAVFDVQTRSMIRRIPAEVATCFAFSPDSTRLVVTSRLGGSVLSTRTWDEIGQLSTAAGMDQFGAVAFDPSGTILAISRYDGVINLLDGATYQELATLESPTPQPIQCIAFSGDGSRLAVCVQGSVQFWDLRLIRSQLSEMQLDWDPPLAAPVDPAETVPQPFIVDVGDLVSVPESPAGREPSQASSRKP
jgi:WD40 repeat protein